jgi:trk system potassium uptake protein TrkA
MKYAVIGLGEFGRNAAVGLARRGAEVIAVDIHMEPVNCVKDEVTLAVKLDGSQEGAMQMHGIGEVDMLIAAIGENFEAQVLTVVHARQAGIKKVIARAKTPDHIRVLKAVGADESFNPEETAARWMVQRLLIANISNYFELAEGFSVVEVEAPAGIVGKTLEELDLRKKFRINLVAVRCMVKSRESGELISKFNPVPDPKQVIQEKDVLSFAGSVLDLANFMGQFE